MRGTIVILIVVSVSTVLAFPERQAKVKLEADKPSEVHPDKPVPSPAELKKLKDLVDKHVTKDANGKPIIKDGDSKELLEGAESFYGHYGYYPSFYPGYYPGFYHPGFHPGFYHPYPYYSYPYYGYGHGYYPYWG